jgi:hypothetical protein
VHYIPYTAEMDETRSQGGLRTNSFIAIRKLFVAGQPLIEIDELGHSETVLTSGRVLREMAQQLRKSDIVPKRGRLGRVARTYQKALCETFVRVEQQQRDRELRKAKERDPDRSHGR